MGRLADRGLLVSLAAVLCAAFAAGALTWLLLQPPLSELIIMTVTLSATGTIGVLMGQAVGLFSPGLRLAVQLSVAAALGVTMVVLNMAVAAWLMFLSTHDLQVLFVLAGFALVASAPATWLVSRSIVIRIQEIASATRSLATRGTTSLRLPVRGSRELAALAQDFNRMAEQLEAAEHEREAVEKSRRSLFAAISHDLRTPLSSMRAMVEALADGVVQDAETRDRYLALTSSEIERLALLIDDLFELTVIESGELKLRLEWLNVNDLIAEVAGAFGPQAERAGINLAVETSATPPLPGDPSRLGRVLYNLLQNAVRHTPHDGSIVVCSQQRGDEVYVAVSDSGDGIPPGEAQFIFDRFYRAEKSRARESGGSGLGLSIARGIVEAHGGSIWVEPSEGSGATIAFTLPARANYHRQGDGMLSPGSARSLG